MPTSKVKFVFAGAVIRAILDKIGILPVLPDQVIGQLTSGDEFILRYALNHNSTAITAVPFYCAASNTVASLTTQLHGILEALTTTPDQIQWRNIEFVGTIISKLPAVNINLQGSSLSITSKSSLKFQNRTDANTENPEADTVDAIPITGYMYLGNGTGTPCRANQLATSNYNFVCSALNGIYQQAAGSDKNFQEPPAKSSLPNVRKTAKVLLQPGQIKYQSLFTTVKIKTDKLFGKLTTNSTPADYVLSDLGKFCIFSLEKVLEFENTKTSRVNMYIVAEHAQKLTCTLSYSNRSYLTPLNAVA